MATSTRTPGSPARDQIDIPRFSEIVSRLDRKTVGRYIEEAKAGGVARDTAMTGDVATSVCKEVQMRPLPPPSQQWQALEARRAQISVWLTGDRPLRLVRVHELLEREEIGDLWHHDRQVLDARHLAP